jgi:transposase
MAEAAQPDQLRLRHGSHRASEDTVRQIKSKLLQGYDSDAIREDLHERAIEPVIPFRRNRKQRPSIDGYLYALRNLVERCFSKLKQSRRLATRYDKTASSYLGFILLASTRLWFRHFVHMA